MDPGSVLDVVKRELRRVGEIWRRFRAWRRISFTTAGAVFTFGAFAVGFAAINTGNNLLYLLLGAMLGFMTLSGWLSEQSIRALDVSRRVPPGTHVGRDLRIDYHVRNRKSRLPSMAVELIEKGLAGKAFLPRIPAGEVAHARSVNRFVRRGVYPLETLTVSTTFPFGLFLKERDLKIPGELVVWPRTDRKVPDARPAGGRSRRLGPAAKGSSGHRGEYRSLREYRPGDDPRDIHWRTSARLDVPVVREYELDGAEALWICLDTGTRPGDDAEGAVEIAATLAARAQRESRRFGLVAGERVVGTGRGPGQLEAVLDALARVDFDPADPPPEPPVDPTRCVLVSVTGRDHARFGDAVVGGERRDPGTAAPLDVAEATAVPAATGGAP